MTTMQMTATHTLDRAPAEKRDPGHFLPALLGIALAVISGVLSVAYVGLPH